MTARQILRLAVEVASELWREHRRAARAAQAWAETPVAVRACPRCREVAYTPGQQACGKCGAILSSR